MNNLCHRIGQMQVGDLSFQPGKNFSRPIRLRVDDMPTDFSGWSELKLERECKFKLNELEGIDYQMHSLVLERILSHRCSKERKQGMIGFLESGFM